MSPDTSSRRFSASAALIILACIAGTLLAAAAPAAAQPPGVNHRRGQAALAHLGARPAGRIQVCRREEEVGRAG